MSSDRPLADRRSASACARSTKVVVASMLLVGVASAAFVPVTSSSREEVFEIPKGTWARRMSGQDIEILPSEIHLVVGVRDVLVLKNSDDVPHTFGPTLLMPGQTFRLPFSVPSENQFACTAHANGQLSIIVEESPMSAWTRLKWRMRWSLEALSAW